MTELTEQWRPIEGYEGLYEVSNLGRVKRVKGYDSLGRQKNEKILKPSMDTYGYLQVGLSKEGKGKLFLVHRLVAQAFIPNPEGLGEINHIDEDKTNNRVDNLEWCDRKYNMNYGTLKERVGKNSLQTKINKGLADPELCGLTKKEHHRLYYQKNRENRLEHQLEYYQKNREQILEQKREYNKKNRDQINERRREHRQKNRDWINEQQREYYQKNRDQINERRRERRRQKQKQTT